MHRSHSLAALLAALIALCAACASGPAGPHGPAELPQPGPDLAAEPPPEEPDAMDPAAEALLLEEFGDDELPGDPEARDPWEQCNRGVFAFNRGVDTVLFDPVTKGYRLLLPRAGRRAIERMFLNLDTPVILINQLLQLRLVDSAGTLGRFLINSSFGVAGMFDPAGEAIGIERREADFGQTMARFGVGSGPYVMLPVFGPSTARDAIGTIFDQAADPLTYFLGPLQWWALLIGGSEGLVAREAAVEELELLEEGSVDFYSALRSAYLQNRDALIREVTGEPQQAGLVVLD